VKTRLDKNEEYDLPALNEGVVNANLKLGVRGGRSETHVCEEKQFDLHLCLPALLPPLCTVLLLTFDFIPSSGKYGSHKVPPFWVTFHITLAYLNYFEWENP
jgi:hypothetical protein